MNDPRPLRRSAGFSLVEVLFVVGIIVILAGLMFPLAGRAQAKAQRANCLNNLRQWNIALNMYLDEHRGVYPGWEEGKSKLWYNVLPPYLDLPSMSDLKAQGDVPYPGNGRKSIFLCPSDRRDDGDRQTKRSAYFSSYAFNSHIGRTITRQMNVKSPSVFVVFAETPEGETPSVHLGKLVDEDSGRTAFRHAGSANFAFADGSAGNFSKDVVWRPGLSEESNCGGLQWNPENDDLTGKTDD